MKWIGEETTKVQSAKGYINWLIVIAFSLLIIIFSSQPGWESQSFSRSIVGTMKQYIDLPASIKQIVAESGHDANYILRKICHFTEYFILALLFFRGISYFRIKRILVVPVTLLFCGLFAFADEFHQIYVSNRTPSLKDVLLDTSGAAAALVLICFCLFIAYILKKVKRVKQREKA